MENADNIAKADNEPEIAINHAYIDNEVDIEDLLGVLVNLFLNFFTDMWANYLNIPHLPGQDFPFLLHHLPQPVQDLPAPILWPVQHSYLTL